MKNYFNYLERGSAWLAGIILLQTLFFKFTAHADSVALFTQLGLEPFGRIGIGVLELIASAMLMRKRSAFFGALLTMSLMVGAIAAHVFVLGVEFNGDGGVLFSLACVTFFAASVVARLNFKGFKLKNYFN